jgi:hypothetical protein
MYMMYMYLHSATGICNQSIHVSKSGVQPVGKGRFVDPP